MNDLVTSISIGTSFTPVVPGDTSAVRLDWRLLDEVGSQASTTCQIVFGPTGVCIGSAGVLFDDAVPLSLAFADGVYALGILSASWGPAVLGVNSGGDITYALNINVESKSVPEPSTLALLGLGLAGIGFVRRRKH